MTKIDFKKTLKDLYRPTAKAFTVVDVPPMQFLMVSGHGDPNTAVAYKEALEALYAVAYKAKFISKNELDRDYVVPPLEGLWGASDMKFFSDLRDKSKWDWTMMIMQPEWIAPSMIAGIKEQFRLEKDLAALEKLRLEPYDEGLAVQILFYGSYDDEGPIIKKMHQDFMPTNRLQPDGLHHEIYLSDPRRTAPEKLKTILRQPVRALVL